MQKYYKIPRIIHWIMAIIIIGMLFIGFYMTRFCTNETLRFELLYPFHKSIGVLLGGLIIFRILARLYFPVPPLPMNIKFKIDAKLARLIHFLLYISMIIMPFSGYVMSVTSGYSIEFFGIRLPNIININHILANNFMNIHTIFGFMLIVLVTMHISGTMKHFIFDRTNLIKRMY